MSSSVRMRIAGWCGIWIMGFGFGLNLRAAVHPSVGDWLIFIGAIMALGSVVDALWHGD